MGGGQRAVEVAPGAGTIKESYNYETLYAWETALYTVVELLFTHVGDVNKHQTCLLQMVHHHNTIIVS